MVFNKLADILTFRLNPSFQVLRICESIHKLGFNEAWKNKFINNV